MKSLQALSIESYLVVLKQLADSGQLKHVALGEFSRLRKTGSEDLWSPWTVVVHALTEVHLGLDEDERCSAQELFQTTNDQIVRIVAAEDGQDGHNGADRSLRAKINEILAVCETEERLVYA